MLPKIDRFLGSMSPAQAIVVIGLTAVCFGLVPLFAKALQHYGVGSATITIYRFVLSALVLSPFLSFGAYKRRQTLMMMVSGALMGLGWMAYVEAVKTVPVAVVGVIYMTYPFFTLAFAWLLLGTRPSRKDSVSAFLIVLAAIALLNPASLQMFDLRAILMAFATPVLFGMFLVFLTAKTDRLQPLERMSSSLSGAALGLLPVVLIQEGGVYVPLDWTAGALIAGLAVITAFIPQVLYTYATCRVGPAMSAIAGSVELPTMFVIGFLAFGEQLGVQELVAAALVFASVGLVPAIKPRRAASPLALTD